MQHQLSPLAGRIYKLDMQGPASLFVITLPTYNAYILFSYIYKYNIIYNVLLNSQFTGRVIVDFHNNYKTMIIFISRNEIPIS